MEEWKITLGATISLSKTQRIGLHFDGSFLYQRAAELIYLKKTGK